GDRSVGLAQLRHVQRRLQPQRSSLATEGRWPSHANSRQHKGRPRLENLHGGVQRMILKGGAQPIDRVKRRRRNVIKRAPVVWDEVPRLQSLEERQRIAACQVAFAKTRLPPRRMPNGKQCEIQVTALFNQMLFHQLRRIWGKRSVAGKEAGHFVSIYKI